ncbi:MAG TPA: hypothetical protein VD963_06750, partial [Phycisphaerales bacterium]|nr:hypothetical protein [Phycisphaerales bacterium]
MTGRVEFSQNSQERNLEDQRASTTPCVRVAGSRPATDRVRALASEAGARVVEEGAGSCEFVLVGGTQAEVVAALGQSAGLPAIALV